MAAWIEVAGDIWLRRPRSTYGCTADDDDIYTILHIRLLVHLSQYTKLLELKQGTIYSFKDKL